ncbi:Hypothetical_protein [Hexamita inflata]|uniref:Hypothetical_protein n=1 Tax=Hexamita inflata TaxID=28002 RepID=A0AA86UM41_9EUKA|nr:Hypothetical protein HINF_LOCUS43605 [Hexamita inflata]CAI9956696.1 Hypothetical protein HINF_LOCUS44341 [Hexamita inflata]
MEFKYQQQLARLEQKLNQYQTVMIEQEKEIRSYELIMKKVQQRELEYQQIDERIIKIVYFMEQNMKNTTLVKEFSIYEGEQGCSHQIRQLDHLSLLCGNLLKIQNDQQFKKQTLELVDQLTEAFKAKEQLLNNQLKQLQNQLQLQNEIKLNLENNKVTEQLNTHSQIIQTETEQKVEPQQMQFNRKLLKTPTTSMSVQREKSTSKLLKINEHTPSNEIKINQNIESQEKVSKSLKTVSQSESVIQNYNKSDVYDSNQLNISKISSKQVKTSDYTSDDEIMKLILQDINNE